MPNITKRFVESIVPDLEKLSQYWDESLKGFGVIVRPRFCALISLSAL